MTTAHTSQPRAPRWDLAGAMPWATALLVLTAAAIHFAVVPEHLHEYVPFGLFFVAAGIAQLVLAGVVLTRPSRGLMLAGATGSTAIIALWIVSRTVGVPIGPEPWEPEAAGAIDVACTAMEAVSAVLLVGLVARRR